MKKKDTPYDKVVNVVAFRQFNANDDVNEAKVKLAESIGRSLLAMGAIDIEFSNEPYYKEPEVDWSKVPVDTPVLVRQSDNDVWCRRYFAEYKYGKVWTWRFGETSWSGEEDFTDLTEWRQAKLAEGEDGSNE